MKTENIDITKAVTQEGAYCYVSRCNYLPLILHKFLVFFQYIIPMYFFCRESILNGSPDLKENASHGLAEVIKLTSPEALKPSVVHITGPLIRILGDRFGANVKTGTLFLRLFLVRPTYYLLPLN